MSVGSGLAASFGVAAETTFGTYAPPARWYEADSVSVQFKPGMQQGGGLAAGRMVPDAARRVQTTRAGTVSVKMEVSNKLAGLLLNMLMGGTPTNTVQGATAAYLQTHALVDNVGKFFTAQLGVPERSGNIRVYTALGCKVISAEFSSGIDDLLMVDFEIDARDVVDSQTLAVPSYPTGMHPFVGAQNSVTNGGLTVKVGATFGSEASVSGVTKVTLKVERPQQVGAYYAGAQGLKAEPITNDNVKITGTIASDFVDKTVFADRAAANSKFSLVCEWVGQNIASTYFETFRIKTPATFVEPATPEVAGMDVVNTSWNIVALNDLTNPPVTIEYMTSDTTP